MTVIYRGYKRLSLLIRIEGGKSLYPKTRLSDRINKADYIARNNCITRQKLWSGNVAGPYLLHKCGANITAGNKSS